MKLFLGLHPAGQVPSWKSKVSVGASWLDSKSLLTLSVIFLLIKASYRL